MRTAHLPSWLLRLVLALLLTGCIDPYSPAIITAPRSYLVVDGFINSQGISSIVLSRTFAIAANPKAPVETKASLSIQDNAGMVYPLREGAAGTYTSAALALNSARQYRLFIRTLAGQEYASDYVPLKNTPPIDSVTWRAGAAGLTIYANAHDDTGATQYYRWEYDETWEITSPYSPFLEYVNHQMQPRTVFYPPLCWGTAHSSVIQLASTTALNKDVISDFSLRALSRTSERLYRRYSVLVQQSALPKEEYQYWELLRKNTESIGTLFDPLPSQLTGNMHCLSNPAEVALGFVGTHSVQQKRLFIGRGELPATWPYVTGYESCMPPDTILNRDVDAVFGKGMVQPLQKVNSSQGSGYSAASLDCVDCRKRGSAIKPYYW